MHVNDVVLQHLRKHRATRDGPTAQQYEEYQVEQKERQRCNLERIGAALVGKVVQQGGAHPRGHYDNMPLPREVARSDQSITARAEDKNPCGLLYALSPHRRPCSGRRVGGWRRRYIGKRGLDVLDLLCLHGSVREHRQEHRTGRSVGKVG